MESSGGLNAKRVYYFLFGLIGIAVIALFATAYLASGLLKQKSHDVSGALLRSKVVDQKQTVLQKAKADIKRYQDLAVVAESIVPQDKDQAQAVREIVNLAAAHNVTLGSIAFPSSSLGDVRTLYSQLTPAVGITGTYILEITVSSDPKVSSLFSDFIGFLDALEHNRRTALVTGVSLDPDKNASDRLSFRLTLQEYVKP